MALSAGYVDESPLIFSLGFKIRKKFIESASKILLQRLEKDKKGYKKFQNIFNEKNASTSQGKLEIFLDEPKTNKESLNELEKKLKNKICKSSANLVFSAYRHELAEVISGSKSYAESSFLTKIEEYPSRFNEEDPFFGLSILTINKEFKKVSLYEGIRGMEIPKYNIEKRFRFLVDKEYLLEPDEESFKEVKRDRSFSLKYKNENFMKIDYLKDMESIIDKQLKYIQKEILNDD
ncbi:MAG: hypothetical protein KJ566_00490 [Nanoarchaeota archaeon]|nr:hypothetical protein [Nanoarchaeota archaeon]